MKPLGVVVLGSGHVLGKKTVKKLIGNQTLSLKKYTWMARAVVTE
jgi:hypothetical protein